MTNDLIDMKFIFSHFLKNEYNQLTLRPFYRFYGSIYVKDTLLYVEPILEDMLVNFPMTYSRSRTKRSSVNAYVYKVYSRKLSTSKHKKKKRKNNKVFFKFANNINLVRKRKSVVDIKV